MDTYSIAPTAQLLGGGYTHVPTLQRKSGENLFFA